MSALISAIVLVGLEIEIEFVVHLMKIIVNCSVLFSSEQSLFIYGM